MELIFVKIPSSFAYTVLIKMLFGGLGRSKLILCFSSLESAKTYQSVLNKKNERKKKTSKNTANVI